ncbi:DoxX-like protein [Promicromonospora sp. AC04]|uniref:DoxX family protein n=1 Tax=Promicromonospora sp. AC04 TaxID=2135723 RepID=UPI000D433E34|nr:DoxX family protein [Promicromonospora sp. AC04]PUB25977.1 DoxX-like protein [Promicromonospora sp. AC04]
MLTTTLWAAQIILALFFLFAGLPKILGRGIDRWTGFDDVPRPLTILIGIAEVAAPVALVLPMLLGGLEWTTPLAAAGLAVVTLMACGFHLRAGEWLPALETAMWAMLAGAVAVGRWGLLATGPSLTPELLVPVIGVLVVALVVNIIAIFRTPAPSRAEALDTEAARA